MLLRHPEPQHHNVFFNMFFFFLKVGFNGNLCLKMCAVGRQNQYACEKETEKGSGGVQRFHTAHHTVCDCSALVSGGCGEGREEEERAGEGGRERQREADTDT